MSAMALNPYASFVGSRDPREIIAATPSRLQEFLDKLGPQRVGQPPAPGKWSPREIASHLADCEVVFAFRLRQTIAEHNHVVQPFDQDQWAKNYSAYDARSALGVFSALRQWNIAFLSTLPKPEFEKKFTHPERGEMTLNILVETMAGHDLNHLKQLEALAAKPATATR
jgi:hypothetical protein